MGVCHQCHGPIGGCAHTGSAFGKGICTLRPEHSHFCKGGILGNDSWAACPLGYMYNADLDLAAGPGFEGTMDTFNFQAGIQNGPASSTPAGGQPQSHPGTGGQQQVLHLDSGPYTELDHDSVNQLIPRLARLQATEERYPGVMNGEQRVLDREFPPTPPENFAPNLQPAGVDGAVGGIPEHIQSEIEKHRAVNQNERAVTDRPASDLVITDLRRDPTLQLVVENVMQDVIRNRIPSLSAAPSAQAVPSNPIFTENVFTAGDGIRVAGVSAVNGDLGARSKINGRQPPIQPNSAQPGSYASDPQPQAHPAYQQGQQQVYTAQPVQTNGQPRFSPVQPSVQQPAGHPTQAMGPAHLGQQQAHHTQLAYQGQQPSYVQPSVHQPGGHPTQAVGPAHQGQPQAPHTQHAFQGQQSSQHAQAVSGFQQGQPQSHSYQQPYSQGPQLNGHPTQGAHQPVNQQYHGGQPSVHHAGGQQTGYVQHSNSTPQLTCAPTHPGPQTTCPPYPLNLPYPSHPAHAYPPNQLPYGLTPHGHLTQPAQQYVQQQPQVVQQQSTGIGQSFQSPHCQPLQPPPAGGVFQHSYDSDSTGRQVLVRTPFTQQQQQQFVTPPQQYRTEFRCSPTTGRQWSIQVPVNLPAVNHPAPQPTYEWKIDPKTGEKWQVLVPPQNPSHDQNLTTSA